MSHLEVLDPPVMVLSSGSILWRVYFRGGRHPTGWSDFRHVGPVDSRFDHHPGAATAPDLQPRSAMYAALDPVTSLAETFQGTRTIRRTYKDPWLVAFELETELALLDLTGSFLTQAGASMGLCSGPRSVGRNWARGFYEAYPGIHGLCYPSSMHGNAPAVALTDRAEMAGALPRHPRHHRSLNDPALVTVLRNAARQLGYALG
jgi:hypothetical protein